MKCLYRVFRYSSNKLIVLAVDVKMNKKLDGPWGRKSGLVGENREKYVFSLWLQVRGKTDVTWLLNTFVQSLTICYASRFAQRMRWLKSMCCCPHLKLDGTWRTRCLVSTLTGSQSLRPFSWGHLKSFFETPVDTPKDLIV